MIDRHRERYAGLMIDNGNLFPENLIIEILSRLPVATLLRFKSVCKSWYEIVESSFFISKHLENYYYNHRNWRERLLILHEEPWSTNFNVCELLIDDQTFDVVASSRIKPLFYDAYFCGPCDGLYLFWGHYENGYRYLWNPSLNEYLRLLKLISNPNLPSDMASINYPVYGFGFDYNSKDYKVLLIDGCAKKGDKYHKFFRNDPLSVFIYSLKSNSWRYWGDLKNIYHLVKNNAYTFVNGCYHWIGSHEKIRHFNYTIIISFDISTESYKEIPLPKFKEGEAGYGSQLVVHPDSIDFVAVPVNETKFSIWSRANGTWIRKVTIDSGCRVNKSFIYWWDDMLVFGANNRKFSLRMCDTSTGEMWDIDESEQGEFLQIYIYKESLVSIGNSVSYSGRQVHHFDIEFERFMRFERDLDIIPRWYIDDYPIHHLPRV
ncbi:hypothetical protein RND81_11G038700 [Saponaria officinalis]|uniref:F-box domain-containing protein n=1 Tax=Saponaria officinalis TaxID=3572 RepID=A0AAW1HI20_SAPOF